MSRRKRRLLQAARWIVAQPITLETSLVRDYILKGLDELLEEDQLAELPAALE